jgi:hypothetical protein
MVSWAVMEKTFVSFPLHSRMDMFAKIEAAILRVLQDHLTTVPPKNIQATQRQRGGSLPAIALVNVDFAVKEVGFGRSVGGVELQDTFSGDATAVAFRLRVKPLRPIRAVEAPPGTRVPEDEYAVDYEQGLVTFHTPPPAAEDNVVVRYLKPTQVKAVKLELRYHLTVWAADEAQRDALTVAVMEALLLEEEALNRQGIFLKPVKGFTVPPAGEGSDDGYGRTLEYAVEASLEVEVPLPRIEKIEIHHE